jgi:hypothetical protein
MAEKSAAAAEKKCIVCGEPTKTRHTKCRKCYDAARKATGAGPKPATPDNKLEFEIQFAQPKMTGNQLESTVLIMLSQGGHPVKGQGVQITFEAQLADIGYTDENGIAKGSFVFAVQPDNKKVELLVLARGSCCKKEIEVPKVCPHCGGSKKCTNGKIGAVTCSCKVCKEKAGAKSMTDVVTCSFCC